MKRQIIAGLTLGSFIIFSFSCLSVREIKQATLASPDAEKVDIVRIIKTSGESIVFFEKKGRVSGNIVQGYGAVESSLTKMEIDKSQVKTIKHFVNAQGTREVFVTTQDDKTISVYRLLVKPETIEMWIRNDIKPLQFKSVYVALSEVETAYAMMFDIRQTLQGIIIPGVLIALVLFIIDKIRFGGILG